MRRKEPRTFIGRYLGRLSPTGQRRLFGFGMLGGAVVAVFWLFFSDGLPILWGPSASAAEIAEGKELFEHEWMPNDPLAQGDGLGPVFNAKSCATCHFQGGLGGGGENEHNATAFEVHSRPGDAEFHTGSIHNFSVDPAQKETERMVRAMYPTIKGRTIPASSNCSFPTIIPDFDPVRVQSVQPTALFGAGWIDLISDKAIQRNYRNRGVSLAAREVALQFDNIPVGRIRHMKGGVGKFGWKGQFARLEDFVAAACANELGLGTPLTAQAKPLTGPDRAVSPDLDKKQFRSLVAFVKTLPKPVEVAPDLATESNTAAHGKNLFASIGCAICHVPNMGGVKGVYSDFLLYTLDDPPPVGGGAGDYGSTPPRELQLAPRPDDDPKPQEWKTPALWGVADSAPYMHDGGSRTLQDAIRRHRGDAKAVTTKFEALNADDQAAVIAFLKTLKAPTDAPPLSNPAVTRLVRR